MRVRQIGDVELVTSDLIPTLHGFTTRTGGVSVGDYAGLNLRRSCADDYQNVVANYGILSRSLGIDISDVAMSKQVHGCEVRRVDGGEGLFAERPDCDAMVSQNSGAALVVFAADCVPILLCDTLTGAVAAAHAGWRGTVLATPRAALQRMTAEFGTNPADVTVAIGPCIERDCYEVDGEVAAAISNAFGDCGDLLVKRSGKWFPDLRGLNRLALTRAGVADSNIDVCDLCTKCNPDMFWSHRRTGDLRGVQGAVIFAR